MGHQLVYQLLQLLHLFLTSPASSSSSVKKRKQQKQQQQQQTLANNPKTMYKKDSDSDSFDLISADELDS